MDNHRKRYPKWLLSSLWLVLAFTAYVSPTGDYYPLKKGMIWVYQEQMTKLDHGEVREIGPTVSTSDKVITITWTVLGTREIDGKRGTELQVIKEIPENPRKIKSVYLVANDGAGPYYYASIERLVYKDSDPIREPKPHPPKFLFKGPLKKGHAWEAPSLSGTEEGKIESLKATVTTPAGTFNNCLQVKVTARYSRTPPPGSPPTTPRRQFISEQTSWYAKEVGLVKIVSIKNEVKNYSTRTVSETVTELVSVKRN